MIKVTEQRYCGWFFSEVARARARILLSDYDGPFATRSKDAPGVSELLKSVMSRGTRLIAISSGPAHELAPLVGMAPLPEIWGNDGLERLHPDGRYECGDLNVPIELLRALAECEVKLEEEGLKSRIDVKLSGITVHWGGLSAPEKLHVRTTAFRALQPMAMLYTPLRLIACEEGLELRLPVASRADAVKALIMSTPSDVPIAYLGHSISDEESFRALNDRGLTALVRSAPRFSAAQICLRPPEELVNFLRDWISASDGNL